MHALKCFKQYWLWLLLMFLALFLIMMLPFAGDQWRSIENDVSTRITQTLNADNHSWAQVDTHDKGRDVLISGVAPSQEVRDAAILLAKNTTDEHGNLVAHSVKWVGTVAEPMALNDPNFSIEFNNNKIIFRGELSSQAEIDRIMYSARSQYRSSKVLSYMSVGESLKKINGIDQLVVGVDQGRLGVDFSGQTVTLTGEVHDEKTKQVMGRIYQKRLGDGYQVINNISVLKPMPAELPKDVPEPVRVLPKKLQVCQDDLTAMMEESTILFASSQAVIKRQSYTILNQIATVLNRCQDASVRITGHTDNSGDEQKNVLLSEKRAHAVIDYLKVKGINHNRLEAKGVGSSQPIADNATPKGRAKNRRIEFTIK